MSEQSGQTPQLEIKTKFGKSASASLVVFTSLLSLKYGWLSLFRTDLFGWISKIRGEDNNRKLAEAREIAPGDTRTWEERVGYKDTIEDGKVSQAATIRNGVDKLRFDAANNFAGWGMGAMLTTMIGGYSLSTYKDMKSLYAEAIGYELGKPPEKVNFVDIFFKSKNAAVKVTRGSYIKRTLARFGVALSFAMPWHKLRGDKTEEPKFDSNVDLGVGIAGGYTFWEVWMREASFFDILQRTAAQSMNAKGSDTYQLVTPQAVETMITLQHKHLDKHYERPDGASQEGQHNKTLTARIAELFNQTYGNTPQGPEPAKLTVGKFVYLIGNGMLDKFPDSLAFVELANRSSDMKDVKSAAEAIKKGQPAQEVFKQLGIDINSLQKSASHSIKSQPEQPKSQSADVIVADTSRYHNKSGQKLDENAPDNKMLSTINSSTVQAEALKQESVTR